MTPDKSRLVVTEIVYLVVLSIAVAALVNMFSPRAIPWRSDVRAEETRTVTIKGISVIPLDEAMRLWRDKAALFVDARDTEFFQAGHIPGAVNVSLDPLGEDVVEQAGKLPRDRRLVLYCSDVACPKSRELADSLKQLGFENVSIFLEGWDGWTKAGGPVEGSK